MRWDNIYYEKWKNSVNTLLGQGEFLAPQKKFLQIKIKRKELKQYYRESPNYKDLQLFIMVQFLVVQNEKIYLFNNGHFF